ncbi:EAL domain-containing protein [Aestuariicella hydrocarbonica]|uniref:cyclic-guanylate-specific phosphodiesterase n=1 Tax=Pseudomaricurvus hydrocarbonicus TaxID=1470433 RepID=A0A9E5MGQ8_9GAMM|nr:EAL domain-containing protein [Aestuariicella hydrocarbonica]NHO65016.1 EAL domain-containing protein [Aestuariicella hydrocarbonica]
MDRHSPEEMPVEYSIGERIRALRVQFDGLDYCQAAQHLVTLVAEQQAIDRCVLVSCTEGELCADAVYSEFATETPNRFLPASFSDLEFCSGLSPQAGFNSIPPAVIHQVFQSGKPIEWEIPHDSTRSTGDFFEIAKGERQPGIRSWCLKVIGDPQKPAAVFCCGSTGELESLQKAMQSLDCLWVFSDFQFQQMAIARQVQALEAKLQQQTSALPVSEYYLSSILAHTPALISVKDSQGSVVIASDSFKHVEGLDKLSYVGKTAFGVFDEGLASRLTALDETVLKTLQIHEHDGEVLHVDGRKHTYRAVKFPVKDAQGNYSYVGTICTDTTALKNAEDALRQQQSRLNFMAFNDSLTSLPNRTLFYDRINHGIARARRQEQKLGVMLLDLDRFTAVNDRHGYEAGDLYLKEVARRLTRNIRNMDTVARLGGDKFGFLVESPRSHSDVRVVAEKILATIAEPVYVMGQRLEVTGSLGASVFPQDGTDANSLLAHADIAMCKAKETHRNKIEFYVEGMSAALGSFVLLENDLRAAIEHDQLKLLYQPQFDLQTNSLVGMEALVRWQHPDRGMIAPENFIPLAEETGLIVELGDWVLRAACRQQKRWLEAGNYCQSVSVNLSPRQFRGDAFVQRLADILIEVELPARYLELEITESSVMEHAAESIHMMNELNGMGVSLAIDDFGTGYSSLSYLKRFPIQKLKIDRSFISDVATDQNDAAIAKSIINLAHNMALNVVAEGVENELQAEWLRDKGCDMAQGYLYSRPLSAQGVDEYLMAGEFFSQENLGALGSTAKRG